MLPGVGAAGFWSLNGGGVAVGWYPVGMWLFMGLGVLFLSFLHVLLQWLPLLQLLQNTLFVHSVSYMALFSASEACWSVSLV